MKKSKPTRNNKQTNKRTKIKKLPFWINGLVIDSFEKTATVRRDFFAQMIEFITGLKIPFLRFQTSHILYDCSIAFPSEEAFLQLVSLLPNGEIIKKFTLARCERRLQISEESKKVTYSSSQPQPPPAQPPRRRQPQSGVIFHDKNAFAFEISQKYREDYKKMVEYMTQTENMVKSMSSFLQLKY
jgi:hypothetical protein